MNKKVLAVVLVVVVAVAGYFIYDLKFKDQGGEGQQSVNIEDIYYYSTGDYFVTNIKDSKSLSKVSVSLALTGKDQTELLTTNNALIRSIIVDVMRSHTEDELRAVDATTVLSAEMLAKLKAALNTEDIVNVYISDFVIQ
jgi:flagellar basal body-associated protein FliL